ncbi:hypothetical protein [Frankia sp. Cppng1_Ct_nod]|uniref:hypothetical protein n=1 Tax=Frankia sp. Cppng1_Ct_nod TaxID=2897162 RepID=UPI0010413CAF|nr:hypothetical protein [Frankia sp. Cppng1_Ct_nod]
MTTTTPLNRHLIIYATRSGYVNDATVDTLQQIYPELEGDYDDEASARSQGVGGGAGPGVEFGFEGPPATLPVLSKKVPRCRIHRLD